MISHRAARAGNAQRAPGERGGAPGGVGGEIFGCGTGVKRESVAARRGRVRLLAIRIGGGLPFGSYIGGLLTQTVVGTTVVGVARYAVGAGENFRLTGSHRRNTQVVVHAHIFVIVLVPDFTGGHPVLSRQGIEYGEESLVFGAIGIVHRHGVGNDNLRFTVVVDVGDYGIFHERPHAALLRTENRSVASVDHNQLAFAAMHHFADTVAVEIEDGDPANAGMHLDRSTPFNDRLSAAATVNVPCDNIVGQ